jgi:hypothetical protein
MHSPKVAYTPRPDAIPESELSALASVYRFILDCHAKKEATRPGGPDDAMKGSRNDRARTIIPER